MQNLPGVLNALLEGCGEFAGENGNVLKNKVVEYALKPDGGLLKLLLKNEIVKKYFFTEVDGVLIFDKIKFVEFISNKEFLPDSYTAFKNNPGLVNGGSVRIPADEEVRLVWPHKDCVLEGGQTKDEQKQDEIFWNETSAAEEIGRLFAPKVFTRWKRFDEKGEHTLDGNEEIDFDNENYIIKGNNLLVLHSIYKRFAGKIKLIYIDPPYNTGSDSFNYNDKFNHSTYLTFMKNRLEIARKLLSDDGSIYINIDYNEVHYLKILMDEIFGRENFQREIIWKLSAVAGYKSLVNNYVRGHDTILFYSKSKKFFFNKIYKPYNEQQILNFSRTDENGRKYKRLTADRRLYLDKAKGIPLADVWDDIPSFQTILSAKEIIKGFKGQKPEKLLERIIVSSTCPGDIVLDFHIGSGTTAAAAHKMNRRYIGIEQMDYIENITIERLKKVIAGRQDGISKNTGWTGGGSFMYCSLLRRNEKYLKKIQAAKGSAGLKSIWDYMQKNLPRPAGNPGDCPFEELPFDAQKRFLIEILEKNQLYVHYSEIKDADCTVSETDIKLNHGFYGAG
ncbi:MAG: site-specific DNA-methyltransferase [Spirochaetaceae bacterium]|jgi:adenine-specific DNA-methyltransferase|nr:site-specific DNA-methyltransferase [Spirochaetaceae bacterium]